jgi:hypothetical protein
LDLFVKELNSLRLINKWIFLERFILFIIIFSAEL